MRKQAFTILALILAAAASSIVGCVGAPLSANPDLQRSVSQALTNIDALGAMAEDPAILQMDFYVFDGKKHNRLAGEAALYHVALLEDSKTDMKTSQQHPDVFVTAGGMTKAYSTSITMTGNSQVRMLLALYDENGIGNNRKERLKSLTEDISVFPPVNAWTIAGVQGLKILTIIPALWDLLFPDETIVPRSQIFVDRREESGKVKWVLPETEIASDRGKVVLTLKHR